MKVLTTVKNFTKKQAALAVVGVALVGGATGFALTNTSTGQAEEPSPIVAQVEDHEGRITNLEGRADATDQKVSQNTADIEDVRQTSGSVKGTSTTTPSGGSSSTTAPSPAPEQTAAAPQAQPTPPPKRTITAMTDEDLGNGTHACHYTLYDAKENAFQPEVRQPSDMACYNVGEVLPR